MASRLELVSIDDAGNPQQAVGGSLYPNVYEIRPGYFGEAARQDRN